MPLQQARPFLRKSVFHWSVIPPALLAAFFLFFTNFYWSMVTFQCCAACFLNLLPEEGPKKPLLEVGTPVWCQSVLIVMGLLGHRLSLPLLWVLGVCPITCLGYPWAECVPDLGRPGGTWPYRVGVCRARPALHVVLALLGGTCSLEHQTHSRQGQLGQEIGV